MMMMKRAEIHIALRKKSIIWFDVLYIYPYEMMKWWNFQTMMEFLINADDLIQLVFDELKLHTCTHIIIMTMIIFGKHSNKKGFAVVVVATDLSNKLAWFVNSISMGWVLAIIKKCMKFCHHHHA